MEKCKNLVALMNDLYPFKKAEEWDQVGHIMGSKSKQVKNVLIALDLTTEAFEEAINNNVDLIITHHPFFFEEDLEIEFNKYPYKREIYDRMKSTHMGLMTLHTNFDKSPKGMIEAVAAGLGLNPEKVQKSDYGFRVSGSIKISDISNVFDKAGIPFIQNNIKSKASVINAFSVIPGACSPEELMIHQNSGSELIITSDIKWSSWITAEEEGIYLASISHGVEKFFINKIEEIVKKNYKNLLVFTHYPSRLY